MDSETLLQLKTRPGVTSVTTSGPSLDIALNQTVAALPVLEWLAAQGCQALYFATAKARLEDVFLALTGRSLRD